MITDTQHTMDFDYSETQEMVAAAAKAFAHQHIAPHVRDWDEDQKFPIAVLKEAGALGFMGILVPESLGGSGLGYHEYIAIIEEISIVDLLASL
jgi:alkylation response protein AidB-like acyl-CoA dehydrogenase